MDNTRAEITTAQAIAEMMTAWNKIEAITRKILPYATEEDVFKICELKMNQALGLTR